jgi:hypothetical protein
MQLGVPPRPLPPLSLATHPKVWTHRPLHTHLFGLFGRRLLLLLLQRRRLALSALWRHGGACRFDAAQLVALDAGDREEGEHVVDFAGRGVSDVLMGR